MKGLFSLGARAFGAPGRERSQSTDSNSSSPADRLGNLAVPPFPAPLPDRKLVISATAEGLLICAIAQHGHSHRHQTSSSACHSQSSSSGGHAPQGAQPTPSGSAVRIGWGRRGQISKADAIDIDASTPQVNCHGIVGILDVFKNSYLLVVTRRERAGDFLHHSRPVYRCVGVLAIPLNKDGADRVVKTEQTRIEKLRLSGGRNSTDEDSSDSDSDDSDDEVQTPALAPRQSFLAAQPPVAADADEPSKGSRAASKAKAASEAQLSASGNDSPCVSATRIGEHGTVGPEAKVMLPPQASTEEKGAKAAKEATSEPWQEHDRAELEDKLIREATRQWARGEMYFSYDFDLTTPLQRKFEQAAKAHSVGNILTRKEGAGAPQRHGQAVPFEDPRSTLPLWRRADRRFFHNEHMTQDFIKGGFHNFVLPMMQGYFQEADLPLAKSAFGDSSSEVTAKLLIVSRRSKERPGLRYQRRGVNDAGQVANYVETEQVLLVRDGSEVNVFSFIQFRGSIPLFWSQSPFALKPPPVLERTKEENRSACSKHFEAQVERYGKVTCVNLAEQSGKEGEITEAYRQAVERLYESSKSDKKTQGAVKYVPFDFHKECAGMKFENVSKLLDLVQDTLGDMDCFWRSSLPATDTRGEQGASKESDVNSGVMSKQAGIFRVSCLDCLDRTNVVQSAFGRHMLYLQLARVGIAKSPEEKDECFDFVFNDMWANNGDQISQCYAGSRALKGDFTRTGRRNWTGMFNDATASVYRMVQGAVTDFWRQTVISFAYGELSLSRLEKYAEELQTVDPSNEMHLARVRTAAIDTCVSMVLPMDESLIAGWTLFSPLHPNEIQSSKLEEKVVLLTGKALYVCAYDFTVQKLSEFTKILLGDVTSLKKGPYVISPREGFHPDQHWGLVISYMNESTRVNVASVKNVPPPTQRRGEASASGNCNFIALKAVAEDFAGTLERPEDGTHTKATAPRRWPLGQQSSRNSESSTISKEARQEAFAEGAADLTSRQLVDIIVRMIVDECAAVGACDANAAALAEKESQQIDGHDEAEDDAFVKNGTIQSLEEAKAQVSMFAGLVEGLRRRVWL